MQSGEVRTSWAQRLHDRGGMVLAAAVGLLVGALLMNLASGGRVDVVEVGGQAPPTVVGSENEAAQPATAGVVEGVAPGEASDGGSAVDRAGAGGGQADDGAADSPSADGPAGATPGAASTPEAGPAGRHRGVTDSSVKIGFTFFNVGIYGVVPAYDVGPGLEKMLAVQQRWRREGREVVHGRKIELVYTEFSITDDASQRAACLNLIDDQKVFAVAAPAGLYAGTDCVTIERKTPLVQTASTGGTEAGVRSRAPYFFMVAPDRAQTSRNWAHWAHRRGLLKGKKIGFYYSAEEEEELQANFIAQLKELGYEKNIVASVVAPDDNEVGPEDTVAVNQFRTAGVDLAVLLLNGLRMESFMQQAESQLYRPQYIASDNGVNTDDTKTTTFPPAQWDGTFAMTSMLYGQRGKPLSPEARVCIDDYRRVLRERDQDAAVEPGTANFNYALMSCHALELAWQALNNAGRDLSPAGYIAGMEAIKGYDGAFAPATTFSAADHTGTALQRTLQWRASCRCWQRVTDFAPFFVP